MSNTNSVHNEVINFVFYLNSIRLFNLWHQSTIDIAVTSHIVNFWNFSVMKASKKILSIWAYKEMLPLIVPLDSL